MPQDKTLWKNNTKAKDPEQVGWTIAVSVYDRDNRETSVPLQSGETVWLTRDERILTAHAPREERNNPFTNGDLIRIEEEPDSATGRSIGDEGGVQVAAAASQEDVSAAKRAKEAEHAQAARERDAERRTPGPRSIGGETVERTEKTELPPELRLGGDDNADEGEAAPISGPVELVDAGTAEEHASVGPGPAEEETGAAVPPAGKPPEGEYAQDEEVGAPEAPAASEGAAERPGPSPDPIDQEMGLHALRPAEEKQPQGGDGRFRVK